MQKFYSLSFGVLTTLLVFWSSSSWLTFESSLPETIMANFIVDSASDAGDSNPGDGICDSGCCGCTLRAAIEESNATAVADVITFSGVTAVSPTFDLPIITNPLTIDGGSTGGVVINGGAITSSDFGLNIQSSNVSLYGLAIQNFGDEGILIPSGGTYNNINIGDVNNGCVSIQNGQGLWVGANVDNLNIVGSFFGTDSGYHTGLGNTNNGIRLQSSGITNATIGGPTAAHGNVIGGNGSIGLEARCNVTIQNNIIGTDDVGTADLGNPINVNLFTLITTGSSLIDNNTIAFSGQSGISCEHDNVTITNNQIYSNTQRGIDLQGNNCTISNNEIYSNNLVGVAIVGGTQNSLSQNEIYCNSPQGIFHSSNGNNNMPSPTITAASMSSISGTAQANATIEVFIQDETGCLGLDCQGRTFVGLAAADGSGNWMMSAASMVAMPADGDQVIATATDASNNTSEFSTCLTVSSACTHPDYDALMALYNSTDGPNWTDNTGWVDGAAGTNCDPCNGWHGVTCNGNGRVDCIDLDGASGASECSIGGWSTVGNNLSGTIPVELEDLTELQSLNLSGNTLSGAIPDIFDGLPNLTNLLLEENQLTEPLPPSLYNATSLSRLVLRNNNISEPLSANFCNLTNLFSLILSQNNFTGAIPSCFGDWTGINILYLNSNNLSGTIPSSLGNLTSLGFLDISSNNLTGEMPSELGNLVSITNMQFAGNNLSGCFPSTYSALCPTTIDFGNNPLLPWEGDFSQFCLTDGSQAAQVGAPCNDGDAGTTGETIQNDCSCAFVSACPTGTTVTVTNTNDDGVGSLREAINCANADPLLDIIEFNIPGPGPHVITLLSTLPGITDNDIVLDGRTQPGNNPMQGLIQIDINQIGFGLGLAGTTNSTIAGIDLYNASNSCITINQGASNNTVIDCYFHGTSTTRGILFTGSSSSNTIGQNGAPNYFWEITTAGGISVLGVSSNNVIQYNRFGEDSDGNLVGGGTLGSAAITIGDGACCDPQTNNIIQNNLIYGFPVGVGLTDNDVQFTLISNNDFQCNDQAIVNSNGANDDNPFPSILSASVSSVSGTHPLTTNQTIEVYVENTNNCTGTVPCQGSILLGTTTSINGNWTLSNVDYVISLAEGDVVTAIATDPNNNTSIFSNCLTVFNNQFDVTINPTAPSCQEGSDDYVPDGTFNVIVTDPTGCTGTYDIVITPVANSSPLGNTPSATSPSTILSASAGTYSVVLAGAGDYEVVVTESGQCGSPTNPVTTIVTVPDGAAPVIPALSPIGPLCEADGIVSLPTLQDGYTGSWSGPGIACCNEFDPSLAGAGTWTLTFDPDQGQCAAIATINVVVDGAIPPTFSFPTTYFENDPVVALPTTSDNNVPGSWSGPGIACCNEFDPSLAGVGSWTVVFTPDPGLCAQSINIIIEVLQLDEPFTIDYNATTPSCQEGTSGYVPDATIDITVNDPTTCGGAVYDIVLTPVPNSSPSGTTPNNVTPAGFFGVPAGTYSFAAAGSGDYDVVVTEVGGPCNPPVNPETIVANVQNGPAPANINPTPVGPFCEGDPIVNLNPVQGGFTGSWSGPGISCCNEFDPSALGSGDWDVLFTPDDGQCANVALLTITINPLPIANEVALEACDEGGGQATFNLTAADASIDPLGNPVSWFEDVALTTPIVNPVSYFASSTTVYAVVNNGFCSSLPVAIILTVNETPLSINTLLAECEIGNGEATFNLNSVNAIVNGGAGFQVEWYLDPLGFSPIPNPDNYSSSSTTVYAIVNNGFCVSAAAEVELIVIPNTVIVPDPIGPYCDTDPIVSLPTVQSGIPGSWSGIGIDCCNEFNPSAAGAGTAILTFTPNGGECANPVQVNVIVAITQNLTFSGLQLEFCDTDAAYQLPNFSDNGTPGSWDIGNTFDPPLFTGTTTTITFTPVDNVCAFPYEANLTVYAEPAILSIDAQNPDDCGVDNGSINITDALGVNLEYSINGGIDWQTSPDFCCLGAGTYNVVIREIGVDICEDTEVVTLTAPMAPVINDITLVDPSDCFETDGSIEVFATGITLEYSLDGIIWQNENTFSNLPQGDYTVQVREVNSPDCMATQAVSLVDPPVPVILDIFLTNPSCDSNADGSITIIVQNAGASTEYSIDGGQNFFSENIFPALASGDYDVVVREAATMDCTTSQTVNLSALDAPIIVDVLSTDPSDCFETDGSIEVIATGITLEYSLDGIIWQNENTFLNLPQGDYTVQVREVNAPDCISTEDVTLVDPPVPVILDIVLTNPTDCSGGSADGQIEIIVQNAGASTEYSIDGGQNFFSENIFPALASGDYDVVVREAATMDCTTTQSVNLSGSAAPNIDDIVAVNPSDCFESDGSIEVFATGITLEYSLDGIVWQNESIFLNLPQGDYTVQVREVNAPDCISMQDVTLVDPPVPVILDIIITNDITCFGSDNGEIEIIVQNAGASTEYSIDGGQNFFSENFFPALAGGDYDVVVREAATMDCTTTQTINVATIDSPQIGCAQQSPASSAGASDGEAAISIQGGTAPYSIDYSGPSSGNDNVATEGTYTFGGLAVGTYTFTITDDNGCFETCTVVIENGANICDHPDYDALMAFYSATDGPNWNNNDGWAEGAAGNNCEPCTWFGVECDANDRVTCIVMDQSDPQNVSCSPFGFNTTGNNLTGSLPGEMQELIALEHLNLTGNNISGPIPEIFDGMDNFNALLMRGNSVESPLPSSLFSRQNLEFIDLRNNSLAEAFPADLCNLTQLQRLLISSNDFTGEIPDCFTDLTAITHFYASSNALSGSIPMDIGNIQGLTFLNLSNNNLTGPIPASLGTLTPSTIFNIANNNLMGCYEDGLLALCGTSFDVSGNPELPWEGNFQEFCDGNNQIGAPCNDGNDFTTGETIQQDCSCQLVVDCTDSDLTFAFGDLQGPSCGVADNGFAGVVPFLGVPPYTYLWSNGDTNPIAMNLSEGLYGFTITDSEGCTVDGQVNLMAINPIELICPDDIDIIIEADENGILLDIPGPDTGVCPADSVRHFAEGATVIPDSPGAIGIQFFDIGVTTVTYYVPGQDTCTFTVIVRQVEDPCDDFAVTPNQVQSPICNDGADGFIEISVSGGDGNYEFLWSNGAVTEDLTDLTVGLYTATITDGMGCEVSVSFWLQEESELDLSCEGIPFSNYGQMASSIQLFASGGQAPYTIDFDGPVSGSLPDQPEGEIFLDDLPEGDYVITLTDADGCMETCATSITNPCTTFVCPDDIILFIEADSTGILLDIPGPEVGDCGLDLIQYNLEGATVQGDTPGAVGIQFFNVGVTTVSYFVPGKDTCTFNIEILKVTDPCDDFAVIPNQVQSPLCEGDANGMIEITVLGGDGNYTYEWSNGESSQDLANLPVGLYTVTIMDGNGCEVSASFWLQGPNAINLTCDHIPGSGTVSFDLSGGTGPYDADITGPVGATFSDINEGFYEFEDAPAGDYMITITDANGCMVSCNVSVVDAFDCNDLIVDVAVENSSCLFANGDATAQAVGGSGDYSYEWSNGVMNAFLEGVFAGTYGLTVTDNISGCVLTTNITIENVGEAQQFAIEETICAGESYLFDGEELTEPDVYTAMLMNQFGCDSIVTLTLNVVELEVEILGDPTYCEDEIGAHRFEIAWDGDALWSTGSTEDFVDVLPTDGTLSVTITDGNGCTAVDEIDLSIIPSPEVEITGILEVCGDELTEVIASGGVNYEWSTGEFGPVAMLPSGIHAVSVTNAEGCVTVELVEIIENELPILPIYDPIATICFGIIPELSINNPLPDFIIDWFNENNEFLGSGNTFQPEGPGNYFAQVRNILTGCVSIELAMFQVFPDTEPPVFENCPGDDEIFVVVWNTAQDPGPTINDPAFIATDNCSDVDILTQIVDTAPIGQEGCGPIVVTGWATDASGNTSMCSYEIEVVKTDDLTFFIDTANIDFEDNIFDVPVLTRDFNNVSGFQFTMMISDTSGGAFLGLTPLAPELEDGLSFNIQNDSTMRILWSEVSGNPNQLSLSLPDSTPIFSIRLSMPGEPGDCDMLMFADDPVNKVAIRDNVGEVIPGTIDGEVCIPEIAFITGRIHREDDQGVKNVEVSLISDEGTLTAITDTDGNYFFDELPLGLDYTIVPFKNDNHPNGLSLVDITRVRDYILFGPQSQFLETPYRKISADATNNTNISLTDLTTLIVLRISGPDAVLPNNTSWRFVDADHEFQNPDIPWLGGFPEEKFIASLNEDSTDNDFIAMKIGDVNLTAATQLFPSTPHYLEVADQELVEGQTVLVPINAKHINDLIGLELDLVFDPTVMKLEQIIPGDLPMSDFKFNEDRFREGVLSGLWLNMFGEDFGAEEMTMFYLEFTAKEDGQLSELLGLGYEYMESIGVTNDHRAVPLELVFTDQAIISSINQVDYPEMQLMGAYPNPFDESTNIQFFLPEAENVQIELYDLSGKVHWVESRDLSSGYQEWLIGDQELSTEGIYFYRLSANGREVYGKLIKQ